MLRPPRGVTADSDQGIHDAVDVDDFRPMDAGRARRLLREAGAELPAGEDQGRWLFDTVDVLIYLTLDDRERLREVELDVGGLEGRPPKGSELLHVMATARALAKRLRARLYDEAGREVDDTHVTDLLRSFPSA